MRQPQSLEQVARVALTCMDLTSLQDRDTALTVAALADRAHGPAGRPAALCVWSPFVPLVVGRLRARLGESAPPVAAVANFPSGCEPLDAELSRVRLALSQGAREIDWVLDWRRLKAGGPGALEAVAQGVRAARQATRGAVLKLIIESGELQTPELIEAACRVGLQEGVDFLKTSTGKTPVGATPQAARLMLQAIASHPRGLRVGFKASGGVRTVRDALTYIELVQATLGPSALTPARFRIGASALLDDVEKTLATPGGDAGLLPLIGGDGGRGDGEGGGGGDSGGGDGGGGE